MKKEKLLKDLVCLSFWLALAGAACSLNEYYNNEELESVSVVFLGNNATVTLKNWGTSSVDFPANELHNDVCGWSKDNNNGYYKTCLNSSDIDCCYFEITKVMPAHTLMESCSVSISDGIVTSVTTMLVRTNTLAGNPVGDHATTVTIFEPEQSVQSMFPNQAATTVTFLVVGPPDVEAEFSGYIAYYITTSSIQGQINEALNYPYFVVKTDQSLVSAPPTVEAGGIIQTSAEENPLGWNYYDLLLTLITYIGTCSVSGYITFQQELACRPNAQCDINTLGVSNIMNVSVYVSLPDCENKVVPYNTSLGLYLENMDGEKTFQMLVDTPNQLEADLYSEVTPVGILNVNFTLSVQDFNNQEIARFANIQNNPMFSPYLVSASATKEVLRFVIPSTIIDVQGNIVEIYASTTVSFLSSVTKTISTSSSAVAEGTLYASIGTSLPPPLHETSTSSHEDQPIQSDDDASSSLVPLMMLAAALVGISCG